MNGQCSICYSAFENSDELCSPLCGHVFHFVCLREWLKRSGTCPECRRKTNTTQIHPIYIEMEKNSIPDENLAVLREMLNNLESEMKLKDTDLNNYKKKSQQLENQNLELRKEVHKLEAEINLKKNHVATLQEQLDDLKNFSFEKGALKSHIATLEEQNKYLKDISIENNVLKNHITALQAENEHLKKIGVENESLKNHIVALQAELKFIKVIWRETAFATNTSDLSSDKNVY